MNTLTYSNLRARYADINDATFAIIDDLAYDKGHSAGWDNYISYLDMFADMARNIIAANK